MADAKSANTNIFFSSKKINKARSLKTIVNQETKLRGRSTHVTATRQATKEKENFSIR